MIILGERKPKDTLLALEATPRVFVPAVIWIDDLSHKCIIHSFEIAF
jgi:hypothetical protein